MIASRSVSLLRVLVVNDEALVLATRKYLADLILACFRSRPELTSYAERLTTASSELLENALKYSPPGTPVGVRLDRTSDCLLLHVSNQLQEDGQRVLRAIRHEIRTVWAEHDAREVFRKKVLASLSDPQAKAMLGYAKIRMETGGRIRARLSPQGRLDIRLAFGLDGPTASVR